MSEKLSIPALHSGGLMLSYKCTNRCKHCLYRCSPDQPNDWMTIETADMVMAALTRESQLSGIHLAGGEATMRQGLLEDIIRLAVQYDVPIDYLETNAAWCTNEEKTRDTFERLKQAGLPAVLVSCSIFHNEFTPFRYTRTCVEVARHVFGRRNVIVWLPEMYEMVSQMPEDKRHSLKEFCRWAGIEEDSPIIPRLYNLIPGDARLKRYAPVIPFSLPARSKITLVRTN